MDQVIAIDGLPASPAMAAAPINISTKWVKKPTCNPYEDDNEVLYVATFADGRTEEFFTIGNDWHDIFVASIQRRREEAIIAMARVDAALEDCAVPLPGLTASSVAGAVNLGAEIKARAA